MFLKSKLSFEQASLADGDALATLRIEAMRESLEHIGRFDPARARDRFLSNFDPEFTQHIIFDGQRVGFVVVRPQPNGLLLDHLYVRPSYQNTGIGTALLANVFARADAGDLSVRVGALKDSKSNSFYLRHGFTLVEQSEFDNYYLRVPVKH